VGKDAVMITNTDLIIRSCERNFGGLGIEKLHEIIKAFMISLSDAEAIELRDTIEVLRDSLEPKNNRTSISLRPRYKLIIDDTKDDSVLRILLGKDLLPISERLSLSNFPDYIDRERANFVFRK
jgi:hypothetical protein